MDGGDPVTSGAGIPLAAKSVAKPASVIDIINAVKASGAKVDGAIRQEMARTTWVNRAKS